MEVRVVLVALALALCGCGGDSASTTLPAGANGAAVLNILHYNNSNSALVSNDDFGGVARFATVVKRARAASGDCLLLSGGDNLGAGAQFQASLEQGPPFFEATAMREIGVTASAIGPGEFYYGPDTFARFLAGLEIPFLSSNLDFSREPSLAGLGLVGRRVVTVGGREVSLIGVTTPRLAFTSTPRGVVVDEQLVARVQAEVERSGPLVVVLANLTDLVSARALARQLRGVDLLVSASTTEVLANPGDLLVPGDQVAGAYPVWENGIPIVLTGANFHYLGHLQLLLDGQGQVLSAVGRPTRVADARQAEGVPPDPILEQRVETPLRQILALSATTVVGVTEVALDGLDADLLARETNLGDFLADAMLAEGMRLSASHQVAPPQVALLNAGAVNSHAVLPVGQLTRLDFQQMLPFASFLVVVPQVSAAQFKELLENAVSRVEQQDGRFAQIAGFQFQWDPAGTAQQVDDQGLVVVPGTRVRSLVLTGGTVLVAGGAVVPGAPSVSVVTLDFAARGGDQYPFRGAAFTALGQDYQQTARRYLSGVLGGRIGAGAYPESGLGRIIRL